MIDCFHGNPSINPAPFVDEAQDSVSGLRGLTWPGRSAPGFLFEDL